LLRNGAKWMSSMRQLQPDRSVVWGSPSQPLRLRWEIERNRERLLEIDQPETARVFQMLVSLEFSNY
jgi:hypothetical protein